MMVKGVEDEILINFIYLLTEKEQLSPQGVEEDVAATIWSDVKDSKTPLWNIIKKSLKDEKYISIYAQKIKVGNKGRDIMKIAVPIEQIYARVEDRQKKIKQEKIEREERLKKWNRDFDSFITVLREKTLNVINDLNKRNKIVKFRISEEMKDINIEPYIDTLGDEFIGEEIGIINYNVRNIMDALGRAFQKYKLSPVFETNNVGTIYWFNYNWLNNEVKKIVGYSFTDF